MQVLFFFCLHLGVCGSIVPLGFLPVKFYSTSPFVFFPYASGCVSGCKLRSEPPSDKCVGFTQIRAALSQGLQEDVFVVRCWDVLGRISARSLGCRDQRFNQLRLKASCAERGTPASFPLVPQGRRSARKRASRGAVVELVF